MAIERIIYFGDSLTDSGAFFGLSSELLAFPLPSAVFGYEGQFSNGDVYADIAPVLLGGVADESLNFAVGGAKAVGVNLVGAALAGSPLALPDPDPALLDFDSNLGGQVGRYLASVAETGAPEGAAASFFIGLNDFNDLAGSVDVTDFDPVAFGAAAEALAGTIVETTLGAAATVAQTGVQTIILNTLPIGTFFPLSDALPVEVQPFADMLISGFNDALIDASAALTRLGLDVRIVDLEALAAEITADGMGFGFLNTDASLFLGTGADPSFVDPDGTGSLPPQPFFETNPIVAELDDDQFAFFDLLHPTTALHGILGAFQAASLGAVDRVEFLGDDDDRAVFGAGDAVVFAGAGRDFAFLGRGDDTAFGGLGRDFLWAGRGDDIVAGGAANDKVFGGRGADVVAGNTGDDRLFGGKGDDALIDGLGSDRAFGGFGDDVFFFADAALIGGESGADNDLFFGGRGEDTLVLAVSETVREDVEAEIAAGGDSFVFEEIGLRAYGIENVVLVDDRAAFDEIEVAGALQDRLDMAELWNLV
ncbi:MAG: SGNH/GDSL hydrolase family protein [Pseudomonadota bacterium]